MNIQKQLEGLKGGVLMRKLSYVKPKVVGTANVHPC